MARAMSRRRPAPWRGKPAACRTTSSRASWHSAHGAQQLDAGDQVRHVRVLELHVVQARVLGRLGADPGDLEQREELAVGRGRRVLVEEPFRGALVQLARGTLQRSRCWQRAAER